MRNLWAFLGRIRSLLFLRFNDCGAFEGRPGVNVSNVFLIRPCWDRVVNRPTRSGQNPARTRKYKPEPGPKTNLKPKSCPKKTKVKFGLKNLAMLPSYFDYILVHPRQKARLRPELSPKFLSTLGPNPIRKVRSDLQLYAGILRLFFEIKYIVLN